MKEMRSKSCGSLGLRTLSGKALRLAWTLHIRETSTYIKSPMYFKCSLDDSDFIAKLRNQLFS